MLLAHDLQQRIDKNALFEVDSLLDRYSSPKVRDWFTDRLDSLDVSKDEKDRTAGSLFVILDQLEVLRADWKDYLRDVRPYTQRYRPYPPGTGASFSRGIHR